MMELPKSVTNQSTQVIMYTSAVNTLFRQYVWDWDGLEQDLAVIKEIEETLNKQIPGKG